jgi:hypothetical protein
VRLGDRLPLAAGIIAGVLGLLISFGLRGIMPARPVGDPLPLMLAVTGLTRGFLYLPWRPALFHLIFAAFLGTLTVAVLNTAQRGRSSRRDAAFAGRIAAIINVGVVAILSVDAVIVGFWYLMSGLVSILISGFVAGRVAGWLKRRPQSD